jgi:hypothetical protein
MDYLICFHLNNRYKKIKNVLKNSSIIFISFLKTSFDTYYSWHHPKSCDMHLNLGYDDLLHFKKGQCPCWCYWILLEVPWLISCNWKLTFQLHILSYFCCGFKTKVGVTRCSHNPTNQKWRWSTKKNNHN